MTKLKFNDAINAVRAEYRALVRNMRDQGHKQEYISSTLGVSQGMVSRWLRGISR